MKRVVEKLKCRRGASILLALLFLLVCVLVAMSVLMAAASNAGKIRSNREEQQKYFTLSSALNLVVGELEKAEYRGNYSITKTPVDAIIDDTKDPPVVVQPEYTQYSGKQEEGNFTCELNKAGSPVLPLQNDLDALFYAQYRSPALAPPDQWMGFGEKDGAGTLTSSPYTLELQVGSPPEDGKGLTQIVVITVTVSPSSGDITLEAKLKNEEYYSTLQAELRAQINSGAFDLKVDGTETAQPVTWKLDKITKKEGP